MQFFRRIATAAFPEQDPMLSWSDYSIDINPWCPSRLHPYPRARMLDMFAFMALQDEFKNKGIIIRALMILDKYCALQQSFPDTDIRHWALSCYCLAEKLEHHAPRGMAQFAKDFDKINPRHTLDKMLEWEGKICKDLDWKLSDSGLFDFFPMPAHSSLTDSDTETLESCWFWLVIYMAHPIYVKRPLFSSCCLYELIYALASGDCVSIDNNEQMKQAYDAFKEIVAAKGFRHNLKHVYELFGI